VPPFGVYIHFPYCEQKCPYCDFASRRELQVPHRPYAGRVLAELAARVPLFAAAAGAAGRRLVSVYFGGGTPGLWAPSELRRVLEQVVATFGAVEGLAAGQLEVTVESNPGSTGPAQLEGLLRAGVNRLSIGVQSLDDADLRALGRIHDAAAARRAVQDARRAGFSNFSFDLIFAVPGQDMDRWDRVLDQALELEPPHLSVYNLTIEPGTVFGARQRRGENLLPEDELQTAMFDRARRRLAAAGLYHYEVSNYARPGREALHNSLYWRGGEYLGLGVSAHSHLALPDGRAVRFSMARDIDAYLAGREREDAGTHGDQVMSSSRPPAPGDAEEILDAIRSIPGRGEVEVLTADQRRREAMFLGLRLLNQGVERAAFTGAHGGDPLRLFGAELSGLRRRGLVRARGGRVKLTGRGVLFADEVGAAFL
jgi:oxygen-independent coproporphyrinogen-3 oxidase